MTTLKVPPRSRPQPGGRVSVPHYTPAPLMHGNWIVMGAALLAMLAVPLLMSPFNVSVVATGAAYSVAAVGVGIGLSSIGMWALMQPAMVLLGAFGSEYLVGQEHWPFLLVLVVVPLAIALVALPLGWLTSRLDVFAFAVLGFTFTSLVASLAAGNLFTTYTGGETGVPITQASIGGWTPSPTQHYIGIVLIVFGATAVAAIVMRSAYGRGLMLMRNDDVLAGSLGVNAAWWKVSLTTLLSAFGGLGGVLVAQATSYAEPGQFDYTLATTLLAVVLIGGLLFSVGPLLGALVLLALPSLLSMSADSQTLLAGIVIVVALIVAPDGIAGVAQRIVTTTRKKLR